MRRFAAVLIALSLLTPSLVCGMAFCPIQSAQAAIKTAPPPCHQAKPEKAKGLMFALDCMGVDLFAGDGTHVLKIPDFLPVAVVFPAFVNVFAPSHVDLSHADIRGPPPDRPVSSSSFFVSTTRLLI